MEKKPILLGTLAYVVVTFPLAIVWHVVIFKSLYLSLGYFGGEPSFALGFLAIFSQGVLLSVGYPFLTLSGAPVVRGLKYALFMGVFFWTSHVIAYAAKNPLSNAAQFYVLETLYLCFQFGIYGVLIGRIYGMKKGPSGSRR
ncbi:MAG TPA: hypothetical protein DCO77_10460 [Nitrospiraceae bacterium]|nr:hypothetical protein [Nitrospiraceae bacterium]